MSTAQSVQSSDELVRRGREFLRETIAPKLTPADHGKFLAIAVDAQDYEIADTEIGAIKPLIARHPGVKISLERVGYPAAHKFRSVKCHGAQ